MARRQQLSLSLLLCVALVALPSSLAMIGNTHFDISSDDRFTMLWSFEFAAGGRLNMTLHLESMDMTRTNNTVQVLLCTDSSLDALKDATLEQVCAVKVFDYVKCLYQAELGDGPGASRDARIDMVARERTWVRLLQLNCNADWYNIRAKYVAVNPGGEYLSLSEVPYKQVFLVTSIGWSLLTGLWFFNWIRYRVFSIKLQMCMTCVPVSEALLSLIDLALWREMSHTGLVPADLTWLSFAATSVVRFVFWSILLAAASGWTVTRASVTTGEKMQALTMCGGLVFLWIMYSIFGGFMLFFVMLQYLLILRIFFTSIVFNREHVIHQLNIIRNMEFNVSLTPAWTKNLMFTKLQSGVTSFVSCQLIFYLWAVVFLRDSPWVAAALENTMDGALAIFIGWYFRMRPFRPYFEGLFLPPEQVRRVQGGNGNGAVAPVRVNINNADGQPDVPLIQDDDLLDGVGGAIAGVGRRGAHDMSANALLWSPGMPIPPCVLHDAVEDRDAPLLVVELPRSRTGSTPRSGTVASLPGAPQPSLASHFLVLARPLHRSGGIRRVHEHGPNDRVDVPARSGSFSSDGDAGDIPLRALHDSDPRLHRSASSSSVLSGDADSESTVGLASGRSFRGGGNGYAPISNTDDVAGSDDVV